MTPMGILAPLLSLLRRREDGPEWVIVADRNDGYVAYRGRQVHGIKRLKVDLADGSAPVITLVICPLSIGVVGDEAEVDVHPRGIDL